MYTVIETKEYRDWFNKQNPKEQGLKKLSRVANGVRAGG